MSCYHPLIGIPTGELTENGKKKLFIRQSKDSADFELELKKNEGAVLLPCGKCIGCRLDYSRSWADRMMLELETEKKGVFLTLTYDNEHITWINDNITGDLVGTLNKRDCQLFMKRLRKEFDGIRIRFFLAGEYGPSTLRPHYHCILFGICLADIGDCTPFGQNELGQKYYISQRIAGIWNNGNVLLSDVSWKTCAYVARYVVKKINGSLADIVYGTSGKEKEFSLMSRKPGIGRMYLDEHPGCLDLQNINISTPEGGLKISIPKYYIKQLELTDPEKFAKLKEDRKRFASDHMMIELGKTTLSMVDYLEVKEMNKVAQLSALKRNKVM